MTGCLDRAPTRTRPVRQGISTIGNLRLARPRVDSLDLSYSPTLRQKSEHLMRLPTTFYRHGYSRDRRGSNAGVSSHFLLPIPGWEVKTCHYTHLTAHCFATDHPRGRIRQGLYPTISGIRPYPPSLDPASTQPRRPPPISREERPTWHRTQGLSLSHTRRHHGVRGWSAIPEARRYSYLHRDRQNFTSRHPTSLSPPTL
jgi:hypothetical protein